MSNASTRPIVLVTGDAILCWDLIHKVGDGDTQIPYEPEELLFTYRQSGGAWHMTNILKKLAGDLGWDVLGVGPAAGANVLGSYAELSHAYTSWTEFPLSPTQPTERARRVKSYPGSEVRTAEPPRAWFSEYPAQDKDRVKLVVVSDDGIEGYPKSRSDLLPDTLSLTKDGAGPWILWKDWTDRGLVAALSGDEGRKLGDEEDRALHGRVIAVASASVLRFGKVRVGLGASWESVAEDAYEAILAHPKLRRCRWVIAAFTDAGALLVNTWTKQRWLVIDPGGLEGTWSKRLDGLMVGATTCLMGTMAEGIMRSAGRVDEVTLQAAARSGLWRMRLLRYLGYFLDPRKSKESPTPEPDGTHEAENPTTRYVTITMAEIETKLGEHPARLLDLKKVVGDASRFRGVELTGKTILESSHGDMGALAREIVKSGPKVALAQIPRLEYGDLITTDPDEIDALAGLATLLRSYVEGADNKPLSLAVFGRPGSGKSFGIKQIAKELAGKVADPELTFNLSQFSDADKLIGALHMVRDVGLTGKIPLVFWDEFDTSLGGQDLAWLRYFLAPMQDGTFVEGEVTHPIGRAIFVFAGGTQDTLRKFYPLDPMVREKLKPKKVPDFVSRLKGSLNVPGINAVDQNGAAVPPSAHLQVRRALILHGQLKKLARIVRDDKVRIDDELIDAFIHVPAYEHGARSMEAIVRMSSLAGVRRFSASCLPSRAQLDLHVDGEEFLRRAQRLA